MYDTFWNNTDSCLKFLKYKGNLSELENSTYRVCNKTHLCRINMNDMFSLFNETLVFVDYRLLIDGNKYMKEINNQHLSINFTSWRQYMSVLYRIIANPIQEIQEMVLQNDRNEEVIGMHIRAGGTLANRKERTYWLTESELPSLMHFINKTVIKDQLPHSIYLTSDSDHVDSYLRKHLPTMNFFKRSPFSRYHTTKNSRASSFPGAMYDLLKTSQGSVLMLTPLSSYSRAIGLLSTSEKQYYLPMKRR